MNQPQQASAATDASPTRTLSIEESLDFAEAQVRSLIEREPRAMPIHTTGGHWELGNDPWAPSWNGGFLTGQMWIFASRRGDPWWRAQAETYCRILEPRKSDRTTHDLGFLFEPSWGRWCDTTGNPEAREVLIEAGRTMANRLQNPGGYLSTWVDPGSTFIDVMMNVGIIFRAAEYANDPELRAVAETHCRTSRRYLMRGDGSTVHEGWFDTTTGEFLRAETHQGWRSDSSWSRGQAWAIYGFTTAFEHTDDPQFLDAARRAADYYIEQTGDRHVPPNDWTDPAPALPWESSAAAVACAGMLHLAQCDPSPQSATRYRLYALEVLRTLRSTEFIAADQPGWQGVLKHATYHGGHGFGVDESVMFGDYFFVEALMLATRAIPPQGQR